MVLAYLGSGQLNDRADSAPSFGLGSSTPVDTTDRISDALRHTDSRVPTSDPALVDTAELSEFDVEAWEAHRNTVRQFVWIAAKEALWTLFQQDLGLPEARRGGQLQQMDDDERDQHNENSEDGVIDAIQLLRDESVMSIAELKKALNTFYADPLSHVTFAAHLETSQDLSIPRDEVRSTVAEMLRHALSTGSVVRSINVVNSAVN